LKEKDIFDTQPPTKPTIKPTTKTTTKTTFFQKIVQIYYQYFLTVNFILFFYIINDFF